jgi:hypothetical protein
MFSRISPLRLLIACQILAGQMFTTVDAHAQGKPIIIFGETTRFEPPPAPSAPPQTRPATRVDLPDWVLVIPGRDRNGRIILWPKDDQWTTSWRIAASRDGVRMIATMGDADDREFLTARMVEDLDERGFEKLARKYGAKAVAVAVLHDDKAVEAILWTSEGGVVAGLSEQVDAKAAMVEAMRSASRDDADATPVTSGGTAMGQEPARRWSTGPQITGAPPSVTVLGPDSQGSVRFTATLSSPKGWETSELERWFGSMTGLSVGKPRRISEKTIDVEGVWIGSDTRAFVETMKRAGIQTEEDQTKRSW